MAFPIPPENVAVYLQKFIVTAPSALTFSSSYTSVGVVTTNSPGNRQWQFTWNGFFSSTQPFEIVYDFSDVDTFGYQITFEGNLKGFLTLDGQIYASDKYISYIPQTPNDIANKIVRLRFKPPCPRNPVRNRSLYYVLNLNDSSCSISATPCFTTIVNHVEIKSVEVSGCTMTINLVYDSSFYSSAVTFTPGSPTPPFSSIPFSNFKNISSGASLTVTGYVLLCNCSTSEPDEVTVNLASESTATCCTPCSST